jgi:hypothetical protein
MLYRACLKTLPPYWGPGSLPPPVCGRKDSLTSLKEVAEALPGSTEDPSRLVKDFEAKGFTKNELAVLVGEFAPFLVVRRWCSQ